MAVYKGITLPGEKNSLILRISRLVRPAPRMAGLQCTVRMATMTNGTVNRDDRVPCVLTGHTLKDPNVTVNYDKDRQGPFSNPPLKSPTISKRSSS